MTEDQPGGEQLTVLVYSHDPVIREQVRLAVGHRPDRALPPIAYIEEATGGGVVARCDAGGIDLAILDGEAWPTGGMGICRQLRDELATPPPVLLLTGRPDDAWLATWSRAEAAVPHPIDAVRLTAAVTDLLRRFPARR
ncbi:MAG TPA: hypothetical protein VNG13_05710 [Mycobacteriales bacterium]|nr:hypothetical protein [Mycobacteriales bacterium]